MRGSDDREQSLFSYVSIEERIPRTHPLRQVKRMVDRALREMSPQFEQMYSRMGRPSIPPEQLLRACLLQLFYSVRSERLLMEQTNYNLLFRWFIGLGMDDEVWVPTTFSKNRDRLLQGDVAQLFFAAVLRQAAEHDLLSEEHFTVDGTLLEAWASHKSFRPKDDPGPPDRSGGRNPEVDFRGEKRSNRTHQSTTDPDARLAKKGNSAAKLCYMASALMENRNGLIVDTEVEHATGTAERESALAMLGRQPEAEEPRTLGADKHYDTKDFVQGCTERKFVPHVAPNTVNGRTSSVDPRIVETAEYEVSQRKRKLVEQTFGWDKTVGLLRKLRHRGKPLVGWIFTFTSAAYNLIRLRTLLRGAVCP